MGPWVMGTVRVRVWVRSRGIGISMKDAGDLKHEIAAQGKC